MEGRTVSHYEIAAKIGEGGMGAVYRARDTLLGRTVAIKVMLGDSSERESDERRRFLQEARAASILNHPGIVTVFDIIREDDADFIVMEIVDGENLAARMEREPLSLPEILDLGVQITDAVGAAHAAGIVHRDLKPGNIMITRQGRVKILDFGLAKVSHPLGELDEHAPTAPQTAAGRIFGTLDYMSPEQLLGGSVDARSDVFSLGTIFYEALGRRRPFQAKSAAEAIHAIVYEKHEALAKIRPDAPPSLLAVIERSLAKEPAQRFPDAGAMSRALVDVKEGRAELTAEFTVPAPRSSRTPSKRILIGALVVGLALAFSWAVMNRSEREVPPKESATVAATAAAPLPKTPQEFNARGTELMRTYWRKGYVDDAVQQFQRAIELDPKNAPAHAGLSRAYLRKYKDSDDKAWLNLAVQTARQAVELEPQLSTAQVALGFAELAGGEEASARKRFEETLVLDPSNADATRGLADLAMRGGDNRKAEALYRKAIELRPSDQELHGVLAVLFYRAQRLPEAASEFGRMIELAPDNVAAYRNLAAVLHMQGNYTAAARELQRSLEIDPDPAVYSNLGTLYFFQGLYPQSVSAFEKALELGANDYQIWANLGDAYRWTPGNQAKASEAFTRALQLLDESLRATPNDRGLLSRQANYLAKSGDTALARTRAAELFTATERDPQNLYRLTLAFELSGDRDRALAAIARAVEQGYSTEELSKDPELARLRSDVRYHRSMIALQQRPSAATSQ